MTATLNPHHADLVASLHAHRIPAAELDVQFDLVTHGLPVAEWPGQAWRLLWAMRLPATTRRRDEPMFVAQVRKDARGAWMWRVVDGDGREVAFGQAWTEAVAETAARKAKANAQAEADRDATTRTETTT